MNPSDSIKPAGFLLRLLASAIDYFLWLLFSLLLLYFAAGSTTLSDLGFRLFLLLLFGLSFFIINILVDTYFTTHFGGPPGKLLTGLSVTDGAGNRLTLARSFFRHTVGYQFSGLLFGLGFFAIIKDAQKQAWHDKAIGSRVVVVKSQWPMSLFALIILLLINGVLIWQAVMTFTQGPLQSQITGLSDSLKNEEKIDRQEEYLLQEPTPVFQYDQKEISPQDI